MNIYRITFSGNITYIVCAINEQAALYLIPGEALILPSNPYNKKYDYDNPPKRHLESVEIVDISIPQVLHTNNKSFGIFGEYA